MVNLVRAFLYQPDDVLFQYGVNNELLGQYIESIKQLTEGISDEPENFIIAVIIRGNFYNGQDYVKIWAVNVEGRSITLNGLADKLLKLPAPRFNGPLAFALEFGENESKVLGSLPDVKSWGDIARQIEEKTLEKMVFPENYIPYLWGKNKHPTKKKGFFSKLFKPK